MWFVGNAIGKPDNAGAAATDYLHLFGLVALGHMWAKIAAAGAPAEDVLIGRAFVARTLPETTLRLARITAGADGLMGIPAAAF